MRNEIVLGVCIFICKADTPCGIKCLLVPISKWDFLNTRILPISQTFLYFFVVGKEILSCIIIEERQLLIHFPFPVISVCQLMGMTAFCYGSYTGDIRRYLVVQYNIDILK